MIRTVFAAAPEDAPNRRQKRAPPRNAGPRKRGGVLRIIALVLMAMLVLPIVPILIYRFVPPPVTPLMLIRAAGGAPIRKDWVPLTRISPTLARAVVASEDEKFCFHHGFDWDALNVSYRDWQAGREPKGASTISMQTAKNLFLWPGRSIVRKGIEAYLTALIELTWSKHRIIEVYLNIIELGDGVYGADAAAHLYFNRAASTLTTGDAALIAAVLPNPRRWSPAAPTSYIEERAAVIRERMPSAALGCL